MFLRPVSSTELRCHTKKSPLPSLQDAQRIRLLRFTGSGHCATQESAVGESDKNGPFSFISRQSGAQINRSRNE